MSTIKVELDVDAVADLLVAARRGVRYVYVDKARVRALIGELQAELNRATDQ